MIADDPHEQVPRAGGVLRFRWPWKSGRIKPIDLGLFLVAAAIAVRAVVAVLPVPLGARERRVAIAVFVASAPSGLAESLRRGERVWCARNGGTFGEIISVQVRPAEAARPGWSPRVDLLILLSGRGRYRPGSGLYLDRGLAVRIGESFPLRTALAAFSGRVERLSFAE
ncbi:MAG: DUF4330 family protein [Firmicutes bacterium]|nr:DUF4330 family protein [Bacillota bacterium]